MPRATSKDSRANGAESNDQSDYNSPSLQMELELLALKAKNADLTNAHAKISHENYEMSKEILMLRNELGDTQAKFALMSAELKKLSQDMSKCTPPLIDILNLFLRVSDNIKSRSSIGNLSNQLSDKSYTPKTKAVMHTVKPHTVNGTVLNLNPTISLTRLNSINDQRSKEEPNSSGASLDYRNSLPSTSNTSGTTILGNENGHSDSTNDELVLRRSQIKYRTSTPLETNSDAFLEAEDELGVEELSRNSQVSPSVRRLTTIHEESICSTSGKKRNSLGEIRIYLSRLSAENMQARNDTFSSTEANVSDTCFNIETTVVEGQEARVSKRVRADIMVFSPHTSSTRVNIDRSTFDDFSYRERGCSGGPTAISAIQSAEVTPSSGTLNEEENIVSNPVLWIPTPSISAMGDIDNNFNCSRLHTSTSPTASPSRKTRSNSERKLRSNEDYLESPRSSRESQIGKKSTPSFINKQRGGSYDSDKILTPTVVLERLEGPERKRMRSSPLNHQLDDPKENENISNNVVGKSKKSKTKIRSKSPKRSVKRKKTSERNSLQDTIREVQIRLSNFIPGGSVDLEESPKISTKRPSRAAKPTFLKDPSLKGKLRRMF